MLDIKLITENPELVKERLAKKAASSILPKFLNSTPKERNS